MREEELRVIEVIGSNTHDRGEVLVPPLIPQLLIPTEVARDSGMISPTIPI